MIPRTLEEWTLPAIRDLLVKGGYEKEYFDFKEMLPHSKNSDDKDRLYATCCAFANSNGGFIVFGVKDDRKLAVEDRIVGMESFHDFPVHFGNYPAGCVPGIVWDFKNPPISLPNGRVINVVQIPRSWQAPHCIGKQQPMNSQKKEKEDWWLFPKRTNKGNEGMSYEEVRLLFLGYYEKRLKLQLLLAELDNIKGTAEYVASTPPGAFSLHTFELDIINSVLLDIYTVLVDKQEIITLLFRIRTNCRAANSIIGIHVGIATTQQQIQNLSSHMDELRNGCTEIISQCSQAIAILRQIISEA